MTFSTSTWLTVFKASPITFKVAMIKNFSFELIDYTKLAISIYQLCEKLKQIYLKIDINYYFFPTSNTASLFSFFFLYNK